MKKLKKVLSVILCGIMALSSILFTACDLFNFTDLPATGGEQDKVDKILKALTTQEMNGLDLDCAMGDNNLNSHAQFSWAMNIEDAAFDMDYLQKNQNHGDNYATFYLRDWSMFYNGEPKSQSAQAVFMDLWGQSILDYNTAFGMTYREFFETEYVKYLKHALSFIGYEVKGDKPEDFLKTVTPIFNSIVIATADAAGAVTETETGIDIDLYKTVNVVLADVKSALQMVAEEKPLLQILASNHVKKYMESLMRIMNVDKMKEKLNQVYTDISADFKDSIEPADLLTIGKLVSIKPNVESTAYEYLLKIVQSDELDILARKFMNLGESIKNFKAPIDPQMAQEMISVINNYFSHGENYFIISLPEGEPGWNNFWGTTKIDCKNLKCCYTVNEDNSLKGLYLNGWLDCVQQGRNAGGNISGQFLFSTEKVSLDNADEYKLGDYLPFADGEYKKSFIYDHFSSDKISDEYDVSVTPIFKDGEIESVTATLLSPNSQNIQCSYDKENNILYFPEYGVERNFHAYFEAESWPSFSLSEISTDYKVALSPTFKDGEIENFTAKMIKRNSFSFNQKDIECSYDKDTKTISFPEYGVNYTVTTQEYKTYLEISLNGITSSIQKNFGLIDFKDVIALRASK